jgi:hypothetical protein
MEHYMNMFNESTLKILAHCLVGITLIARGEESPQQAAYVETKIVESFSIAVRDQDGYTNSAPDKYLTFAVWCTNGSVLVGVPPQREYAFQVELYDSDGITVAKTEAGKKVGSKFDDFDESVLKRNKVNLPASKRGELDAWSLMFRPIDLFKIDKPGRYILRIRFQFLAFLSPVTSKPATKGRIKTGHSEVLYSYQVSQCKQRVSHHFIPALAAAAGSMAFSALLTALTPCCFLRA